MWKMDAPRTDNRDIFRFAERNEKKFVDLVKKETQSLGMIKAEFALSLQMPKKTEKDRTTRIHQYFKNKPKEQMKKKSKKNSWSS